MSTPWAFQLVQRYARFCHQNADCIDRVGLCFGPKDARELIIYCLGMFTLTTAIGEMPDPFALAQFAPDDVFAEEINRANFRCMGVPIRVML